MSWLLFLDESGHDHKTMPYEVRGGIALKAAELWSFVQDLKLLELSTFGAELSQYGKQIKGCKLLDKDRFKWAIQGPQMSDVERRKHCRGFLTKGLEKKPPSRNEFTAYGQASLEMARGVFQSLRSRNGRIFAAAIPKGVARPETFEAQEFLRKDHVFLFERYYDFLREQGEHGLLVMDEVEKATDRRFVRQLEAYFSKTHTGRFRTNWIVPVPFFVASDMAYPVQAADLAIYCTNCGFRLPNRGMDAPSRPDISDEFRPWLSQLQYRGEAIRGENRFLEFGIVFVPDPYTARAPND